MVKIIKKVFGVFGLSTSIVVQLALFILASILILFASYILGHGYLEGNTLIGNDSYSYFAVINWFNNYFPKVPYWFPLQGAGISLFAGYPYAPAYFVILLSKLSSLDLVQSFRLLGFLSVPLTAIGIFVFCWTRLVSVKPVWMRQVLGIFASLFYVTSPLAWIWLVKWGFYTESVSHIFVPWTLIFFDIYLDKLFDDNKTISKRLFFVLAVIFLVITTWVHIFSGLSVLPIFAVLVLYRFIFSKEKKLKLFKRIIGQFIILGLAFFCLFSFRYYEFSKYYKFVADGGFRGYKSIKDASYLEVAQNMLTTKMTLSFEEPLFDTSNPDPTDSYRSTIKDLRFPLFVWVLTVPTLVFGFFRSKKMFALSLYVVFGLISSTTPEFILLLGKLGPLAILTNFLKGRIYFIPMRLVIPVVAAYGAYVLWDLLGAIISWFTNKITKYSKYLIYPIRVVAVLVLTLITISVAVYKYYNQPYQRTKANIGAQVPTDLRDIWGVKGVNERERIAPAEIFDKLSGYNTILDQFKPEVWPDLQISSQINSEIDVAKAFYDPLPHSEYRFDISGFSARQVMLAPLVNNNSQIQMYINTLSLIYDMWNYQTQVMYTQSPLYQKPGVLAQIGKWYGLNYVFLAGAGAEPMDYWNQDSGWEQISKNWWKFNSESSLVEVSDKPKILVISDSKRGFYGQSFRFFTLGALPYEMGIPVEGSLAVDDYSLKELQSYDIIFMRGYDYKLKFRAYNLLDKYVKNGGKLIFDTGWQFNIPDWEIEKAPDFMPFNSLSWKNLSMDSEFVVENKEIAGSIDITKFGDLTWENTSWGVSAPSKLRSWAKTVLSYDGVPLVVAGDYGKGKVIWMGFNLVPHSEAKDSLEEVYFFQNIIKYLTDSQEVKTYKVYSERQNPDQITFFFGEDTPGETNLIFKESYHPYWHAYVYNNNSKKEVPVLRVGPGFKSITLPKLNKGDSVVLELKMSLKEKLSDLLSIITAILLFIYLIYPSTFSKIPTFFAGYRVRGITKLKIVPKKLLKSFLGESKEDEDY